MLITFGTGDDIPSWFGHSAILVEDTARRAQRVYNYGMFSFGPDLLPKFLMGRLEFWVGESSFFGTLRTYTSMNRDIRLQELNLSPVLRMRLARALADNVLPENRHYLYHHYDDNCATRVRDIIDEALGGQLREHARQPGRMTLREHTRRHSQHNPYIDFVLMLWMNDEIDRTISVWEEMFLPEEMERVLGSFVYVDERGERRPLVSKSEIANVADGRSPVPERPARTWAPLLVLGLALGGGAVALSLWSVRSQRRLPRILLGIENMLVGSLVGLPAVLLFLMWTITEHTVTYRNENLLLANPLTFVALPLGVFVALNREWALRWIARLWLLLALTSLLALLIKALPWFQQDNWMIIALLLPANLGLAICWWLLPSVRAPWSRHFWSKENEPSQGPSGGLESRRRERSKRSSAGK